MAISSVNFQKTKPNSVAETTREFEAKYLLKKEYRQENHKAHPAAWSQSNGTRIHPSGGTC